VARVAQGAGHFVELIGTNRFNLLLESGGCRESFQTALPSIGGLCSERDTHALATTGGG
jgi:hypothetical protein